MRFVLLFCMISSLHSEKNIATCDFFGQLGNQMFQAAATIGYALDHDCEISFPTIKNTIRGELNYRYIFHRLNITPFKDGTKFVFHDHNSLTDTFYYAPIPDYGKQNVRLSAHFCSEKYFVKHRDIILDLFSPTQEIVDRIKEKYGTLLNGPTVAVHVRTFLKDGHEYEPKPLNVPDRLAQYRWVYFINALGEFPSHYRFLVFSDDIEWTKNNFPQTDKELIFIEGNPHYFDFYMMSFCDHQIVSPDSTYSWWAAWLNRNPNKIVVIADLNGGKRNSDIICKGWRVVPKYPPEVRID